MNSGKLESLLEIFAADQAVYADMLASVLERLFCPRCRAARCEYGSFRLLQLIPTNGSAK